MVTIEGLRAKWRQEDEGNELKIGQKREQNGDGRAEGDSRGEETKRRYNSGKKFL
jgi:hypothetical protein